MGMIETVLPVSIIAIGKNKRTDIREERAGKVFGRTFKNTSKDLTLALSRDSTYRSDDSTESPRESKHRVCPRCVCLVCLSDTDSALTARAYR